MASMSTTEMSEWSAVLSPSGDPSVADLTLETNIDRKALLRGTAKPNGLFARLVGGGSVPDVFHVGSAYLYGVSERFARAVEGFVGVSLVPLHIRGHDDRFAILSIHGTCGLVDFRASTIEQRLGPFVRLRGLVLSPTSGAMDFCVPENHLAIVISRRVAAILGSGNFSNLRIDPLSEYELDVPARMIE